MIRFFGSDETRLLFDGRATPRLPADILRVGRRRLRMLHRAQSLSDLRAIPGNDLEVLRGDRAGQHSIRINDQWRICFTWRDGDAHDVEIVDYH